MRLRRKLAFLLLVLAGITYPIYRFYCAEQWAVYSSRGVVSYQQGNYNLAISNWREALHLIPDDGYTHFQIGNAYYKLGKLIIATSEYKASLHLTPENALAYLSLGDIYHKQHRYSDSIDEYRKALRINPNVLEERPDLKGLLAKPYQNNK